MVFLAADRAQLDVSSDELNFQLSGEVRKSSAQSIGQMFRAHINAAQGQWSRTVSGGETLAAALTRKTAPAAASLSFRI